MSVKILVAGDFCPQQRVKDLFEEGKFQVVLGNVKPFVECADFSIVNFECPVTKGGEKKIKKCGPNLQCDEKGMEAISWAGFCCVTLANNHFRDYGDDGVRNTLAACEGDPLERVGGGKNIEEASRTLYKEIKGEKVAIVNCCEHEFSIATETTGGSNPLNPIRQYYAIKDAREKADYVLVIVHGGHEHYQLPSPRMQETYRFFIDSGADAVVNHHQHCYSGYEEYHGRPIFYGLGNFCFDKEDKRNGVWNKGYLVQLEFGEREVKYDIIPYVQCDDQASVQLCDKADEMKVIDRLNGIIANGKQLAEAYGGFVNDNGEPYLLALEPYTGHFGGLRKKRLVPSLLNSKYFLRLYGYLLCESHYQRLLELLRNKVYGKD